MIRNHDKFTTSPHSREDGSSSNVSHPFSSYPTSQGYPNGGHENLVYVMPSDSVESPTEEPVTKNAGSRWREDETEALVEIWRDKICQTRWWKQSKGVRVNKEMWEEIAQLLAERDVFRTPNQCQIRMKNLLQYYRQTIDNKRAEKSWDELPEYFDIVDKIMSRREGNGSLSDENGYEENENRSTVLHHHPHPNENGTHKNCTSETEKNQVKTNESQTVEQNEPQSLRESRKRSNNSIQVSSNSPPRHFSHVYNNYFRPVQPQMQNACFKKEGFTQPQWISQPQCCEAPNPKRPCTNTDYQSTLHHFESTARRNHAVLRPSKQYYDFRSSENQGIVPSETCTTRCNSLMTRGDFYQQSHMRKSQECCRDGTETQSAITLMQEFMQLQHKQMENLLEIEKKRLEIEERRLQEEKDSGNRNAAFLMEAVKILAETFRNSEAKNEKHM